MLPSLSPHKLRTCGGRARPAEAVGPAFRALAWPLPLLTIIAWPLSVCPLARQGVRHSFRLACSALCGPLPLCQGRAARSCTRTPHPNLACGASPFSARRPSASADVPPLPLLHFLLPLVYCHCPPCPCLDPPVWSGAHLPSSPVSFSCVCSACRPPSCRRRLPRRVFPHSDFVVARVSIS